MTQNKTEIRLLRINGKGIQGTLENAKHHAEKLVPFVRAMRPVVAHLGFKLWIQGHNVHEFHTEDGRRYTLRGIVVDKDKDGPTRYVGVRLALRHNRSEEDRLFDIDKVEDIPYMLDMMRHLAKPQIGRDSSLVSGCGSNP